MDECLQRLIDIVDESGEDLRNLVPSERIVKLVRTRLEMQAPYIQKWPQALSIQVHYNMYSLESRLIKNHIAYWHKLIITFGHRHNHRTFQQALSRGRCWLMRYGMLLVMRPVMLIGMWSALSLVGFTQQLRFTCSLIIPQVCFLHFSHAFFVAFISSSLVQRQFDSTTIFFGLCAKLDILHVFLIIRLWPLLCSISKVSERIT